MNALNLIIIFVLLTRSLNDEYRDHFVSVEGDHKQHVLHGAIIYVKNQLI